MFEGNPPKLTRQVDLTSALARPPLFVNPPKDPNRPSIEGVEFCTFTPEGEKKDCTPFAPLSSDPQPARCTRDIIRREFAVSSNGTVALLNDYAVLLWNSGNPDRLEQYPYLESGFGHTVHLTSEDKGEAYLSLQWPYLVAAQPALGGVCALDKLGALRCVGAYFANDRFLEKPPPPLTLLPVRAMAHAGLFVTLVTRDGRFYVIPQEEFETYGMPEAHLVEDLTGVADLTILRTYATVNKMGANPPASTIDAPVVVADAVWPVTQYGFAVKSGLEDQYRSLIPGSVLPIQDYVFPASCAAPRGTATLTIRSSGDAGNTVWFAPSGTTTFTEGATMTKAAGTATSIAVPTTAGTYKLFVVDSQGKKLGESTALLRVGS